MLKLIRNELIKEYTLKRIVITLVIFIVLTIATYLGYFYIPHIIDGGYGYLEENYYNSKNAYENALEKYTKDNSDINLFALKVFEETYKYAEFKYKNHISYNDWQSEALVDLDSYAWSLITLELMIDGADLPTVSKAQEYSSLSITEQRDLYEKYKRKHDDLLEIIKNGSYYQYASIQQEAAQEKLSMLIHNGTDDEREINNLKYDVDRYTYIIEKKIQTNDDYRVKELLYLDEIK